MKLHHLTTEVCVPRLPEEVFAFFADARNLARLTPPWLRFEVLTPTPIEMRVGTVIDYRLRLRGVPVRWQSEITDWEPPLHFADEQRRGPYRVWRHEHSFSPVDGGTSIRDDVDYAAPGWILEPLIHRFLVGPDVKRIFAYRRARLRAMFGAAAEVEP